MTDLRPEEISAAHRAVDEQLTAYRALAKAVAANGDPAAVAALERFEPVAFNGFALALDRRLGAAPGAPAELALIAEALRENEGVLRGRPGVEYRRDTAVLGLSVGDRVALSSTAFRKLARAALSAVGGEVAGRPL